MNSPIKIISPDFRLMVRKYYNSVVYFLDPYCKHSHTASSIAKFKSRIRYEESSARSIVDNIKLSIKALNCVKNNIAGRGVAKRAQELIDQGENLITAIILTEGK